MAKLQSWNALPKCSFCGKSRDRVAKSLPDPASGSATNASTSAWTSSVPRQNRLRAETKGATHAAARHVSEDHARPATYSHVLPLVLASGSASRLRVLRDAGFDPRSWSAA